MMAHQHVYDRVPKLAGSWIACVKCNEPYRGPKYLELINEHEQCTAAPVCPVISGSISLEDFRSAMDNVVQMYALVLEEKAALEQGLNERADMYEKNGQPGPLGYNLWGWRTIAKEIRKVLGIVQAENE